MEATDYPETADESEGWGMSLNAAFIFGDVHGAARKLKALIHLARTAAGGDVDLYSVGDLIDRGPDSKEVIKICLAEGVQGLMGNHELWMYKYLTTGEFDGFALHGIMGGKETLTSYRVYPNDDPSEIERSLISKMPDSHKEFFLRLPLSRVLEVAGRKYRLTHGGIPRRIGEHASTSFKDLAEQSGVTPTPEEVSSNVLRLLERTQPQVFLWGGATKGDDVFAFPDESYQVFGHTPWLGGAEISDAGRYIALDTGCGTCPPHRLSGVLLFPDGERKILSI